MTLLSTWIICQSQYWMSCKTLCMTMILADQTLEITHVEINAPFVFVGASPVLVGAPVRRAIGSSTCGSTIPWTHFLFPSEIMVLNRISCGSRKATRNKVTRSRSAQAQKRLPPFARDFKIRNTRKARERRRFSGGEERSRRDGSRSEPDGVCQINCEPTGMEVRFSRRGAGQAEHERHQSGRDFSVENIERAFDESQKMVSYGFCGAIVRGKPSSLQCE